MKKVMGLLILGLFILPTILAIDISLDKKDTNDVIVSGLDTPSTFTYAIKNNGKLDIFLEDNFE